MRCAVFVGREAELAMMDEGFGSPRAELCVVYGRRRVGKSTLLEHFVTGKPAFFFLAGRESKRLQLRRFVRELGDACGDPLTSRVAVGEWEEALTLLDRSLPAIRDRGKGRKTVVVFDEFQWMCAGCPELISDIQRFWDQRWKDRGDLCLVLCGSSISFMLGDILARKSPLFGRRTRSFKLEPFRLREATLFIPNRNPFEAAEAYLACGGIPKYLEIMGAGRSFRSTLARECFSPTAYFVDEVRFVLSEQLREPEHYFGLLEQLAVRAQGVRELEKATGIPCGQIMFYLERLQMLGFVARHVPMNAARNSKTVRYRLEDYYLRLYFTFIHPQRERIRRAPGGLSFEQAVGPGWDAYAGRAFEQLAREHADIIAERTGHGGVLAVGSYWQRGTLRKHGVQIDVVVQCQDRTTLVCECKWGRGKTGMDAVAALRRQAAAYPNTERNTVQCVLVAAGGVTDAVRREKDIAIITLDDLRQ